MGELLKETLGLHLLHWAFARSDVWCTASRCAVDFVNGIHEPLERSAAVLDGILTGAEEEEEGADDEQQRIDDDDADERRWFAYGNYEARRDMWLNGLDMRVQRHNFGYADDEDEGESSYYYSV